MPAFVFETSLGPAAIEWDGPKVLRFCIPGSGSLPANPLASAPRHIRTLTDRVVLHCAGSPQDFRDAPLDFTRVPPFAAKVYQALRATPHGSTVGYGELAERAGSPGASRAVGTAMAKNPWPLLVPCHRVLAEGGRLGGYSAGNGLGSKVQLLALDGVHIDPARQISLQDPRFGKHIEATGPCGLTVTAPESVFAALLRSIVYQQLTGKAAETIFSRVRALYPQRSGKAQLRAEHTASLSDAALLGCGLSRNKLAAVRDLAARAASSELVTLERARALSDEELVTQLSQVRGIGRWSVQMFAMFSLGRTDILPLGDLGVQKGFARLFGRGQLPSADELAARGERWRPFRSIASWYLWRAAELR